MSTIDLTTTPERERDRTPRRVLVTGGAGFIGSHLCRALLELGDEVTVLDDLSTGSIENVDDLLRFPRFDLVEGDVCDAEVVDRLVSWSDLVVHLAAAVGVQMVVEDALSTLRTNVRGTEVVLDVAARYGTKVLVASTSEVYGKCLTLPAAEDDDVLIGPSKSSRWSYAASKFVDEFLALAYHRQLDLPVVVFRLFNTVGPRQSGRYGMVVPRFVAAALDGRPLPVHGDGQQSRSFCHVADVVVALLGLAVCEQAVGRVFNVGGSVETTIGDLARTVLTKVGRDPDAVGAIERIPYDVAYAPGYEDIRRRVADTTRIRETTGWQPTLSLDDILDDVVADLAARATART